MIRLGGDHVYAVVQVKDKPEMPRIYHNGLDVETPQEVDEAYRTVARQPGDLGAAQGARPVAQHGTYSFMFWDIDDNCWEILSNPPRGYRWIFDRATRRAKAIWSTSSTSAGPTGRGRVSAGK